MLTRGVLIMVCIILIIVVAYLMMTYRRKMRQRETELNEAMFAEMMRIKHTTHDNPPSSASQQTSLLSDPTLAELGFGDVKPTLSADEFIQEEVIDVNPPKIRDTSLDHIIVLNLLPRDQQTFSGYDLLQTLLAQNLRFGAMNIFHLHEQPKGKGREIFSLAQSHEPGSFDLNRMGDLASRGLTAFFDLQKSPDPLNDFEIMLDKVINLAEELDAEITTFDHELLSDDQIMLYQQRIINFQREQLES
ncbi:MAG: cell division protein ZipA C-terminal FtsZ-binding domain-containing protein [Legionellales bacterium]|nr:cell division protein ZipA C-terminal FtsZ-binding domain-containing protein [Legionellales bacterium]